MQHLPRLNCLIKVLSILYLVFDTYSARRVCRQRFDDIGWVL